jgi:mRNA interferase RelE/StbE
MGDSEVGRAYVRLIEPAFEDLRRLLALDPQILRWALKKMLLLERHPNAGEPLLGGLVGWRKLIIGNRDWRLVWRITHDAVGATVIEVAEVWAVGARADAEVYAEMVSRVESLPTAPATITLVEVIERLGKVSTGVTPALEPTHDPIPPWLVHRLFHQVGMELEEVTALSGEEAMHRWESFITRREPPD